MNIVEFIETCNDDDLRIALAASPGPWSRGTEYRHLADWVVVGATPELDRVTQVCSLDLGRKRDADAIHIARHDPLRVFAQVRATRAIVADRFRHFATVDGEWGCCHDADAIRAGECPDNTPDVLDVDSTFRALARIWGDRPEFEPRWLENV